MKKDDAVVPYQYAEPRNRGQMPLVFPVPSHELLVDRLADAALAEIRAMAAQAQHIITLKFDSLHRFTRRSLGQRRRHFNAKRGIKP